MERDESANQSKQLEDSKILPIDWTAHFAICNERK